MVNEPIEARARPLDLAAWLTGPVMAHVDRSGFHCLHVLQQPADRARRKAQKHKPNNNVIV
eukprot:5049599-Heterocapsa_arctica.AAC.1